MLTSLYRRYRFWRFKNSILLLISVILLFIFIDAPIVQKGLHTLGSFGYVGVFFSGLLFVSTFTVLPSSILLFHLTQELNPVLVTSIAVSGAVLGDFLMFRFMKNKIFTELRPVFTKLRIVKLERLFATPFFGWFAPVIGAAIIASPSKAKDDMGLVGISKMKSWQFLLLSFVLNSIGILLVITLARMA